MASKEAIIIDENQPDELKARLERAENILRTLASGETDAVMSKSGPLLMHSVDDIERERQVKLALERLVTARALELVAAKEAKDQAEAANRAKSDFLSSMSHELRTPLNAILGFAQLLEIGPTPLQPDQKRGVDQILSAGWHLLMLVNEILDLAQIEAGITDVSEESVPVWDVMRESQSLVEPLAQRCGITLDTAQFDVPYFVKADRIRLQQVLINLLSNAVNYNRPGGRVDVECTPVTAERIRIGVRDTGEGLTPEQLAQLFQPFNRLGRHAATSEGTGIGLVVAKRLVELMGGSMGVESSVGLGSVFWIELTLSPAPPMVVHEAGQVQSLQAPTPVGASQNTVLYVEDNLANLNLIEQLFDRRPNLHLLTATDGHQGIALARTCVPQVILMDINLPGMDGIEVMKILRADPSTQHIPVIAVSALAMPVDVARALGAGFFSYLTKPIKLTELMAAVDEAIKSSKNG